MLDQVHYNFPIDSMSVGCELDKVVDISYPIA